MHIDIVIYFVVVGFALCHPLIDISSSALYEDLFVLNILQDIHGELFGKSIKVISNNSNDKSV
jgi:hypothetical protein